jgi:uncharacterized protein (DUF433 family)
VTGTRITVELTIEKLAAGETVEQLLIAHPRLTREAIQADLRTVRNTLFMAASPSADSKRTCFE